MGAVRCRHEQHVNRWNVPLKTNGPLTSPAPTVLKGCNGIPAEPAGPGDGGGGGGAGPLLVMLQIIGQSVHCQLERQWMLLQSVQVPERLPLPWQTEQLGGQPGQSHALAHLSALQHGGCAAVEVEVEASTRGPRASSESISTTSTMCHNFCFIFYTIARML